jgi:hypothetical protein
MCFCHQPDSLFCQALFFNKKAPENYISLTGAILWKKEIIFLVENRVYD